MTQIKALVSKCAGKFTKLRVITKYISVKHKNQSDCHIFTEKGQTPKESETHGNRKLLNYTPSRLNLCTVSASTKNIQGLHRVKY